MGDLKCELLHPQRVVYYAYSEGIGGGDGGGVVVVAVVVAIVVVGMVVL